MMKRSVLSAAIAAMFLGVSASCASVRSTMMGWNNRDWVGDRAPELPTEEEGGDWVNVASTPDPEVADWRLLAFFLPT